MKGCLSGRKGQNFKLYAEANVVIQKLVCGDLTVNMHSARGSTQAAFEM